MPTSFNILAVRQRLGREFWAVPVAFGNDGWLIDNKREPMRIIVSDFPGRLVEDQHDWIHASISHRDRLPTYEEVGALHRAVWPEGYAYEVRAPSAAHINIAPRALHLWGRMDGAAALPDFGRFGTI